MELPARPHGKVQPLAVDTLWKLIDAAEELGGAKVEYERQDGATETQAEEIRFTRFVYKPHWFVLSQTEGAHVEPEPMPAWDADAARAPNPTFLTQRL